MTLMDFLKGLPFSRSHKSVMFSMLHFTRSEFFPEVNGLVRWCSDKVDGSGLGGISDATLSLPWCFFFVGRGKVVNSVARHKKEKRIDRGVDGIVGSV